MPRLPLFLIVMSVAGVALSGGVAAIATTSDQNDAGGQSSLIEDFGYPGAEQVKAKRGITLISGDGHLVLVDCAPNEKLIEVRADGYANKDTVVDSNGERGHYCFRVTGPDGFLKMELKNAFNARADDRTVTAKVTANDQTTTKTLSNQNWTNLDITRDPDNPWSTVLELRATS
ncbi:hypothetical protein [Saccharothrix australiensis]|uniref:Secreted protein n=1 Tax=Saccharothrix australiensis TaxID=2072 RepID=A0A495W176_9PSEU|nr:hypothetical protein [Saccharothrix australiensis]RKT53628.1 hypothetical protein C8E97_2200 [Saccharothrix australiensis]